MDSNNSDNDSENNKQQTTNKPRGNKWIIICSSILVVLIALLFNCKEVTKEDTDFVDLSHLGYDPCCTWPCENDGWCVKLPGNNYTCDCFATGFIGQNCHIPATWGSWLALKIKPEPATIHHIMTNYDWLWDIINTIKPIHSLLMQYVYLSRSDPIDTPVRFFGGYDMGIHLAAYYNETYYARSLPPVPKDCPTVMGDKGPEDYPDLDILVEKVFLRREFKPDPHNINVFFTYWAQHFTHQFFRTDQNNPDFTRGRAGVDGSNIYGLTEEDRQYLRSGVDGKLKSQSINGEEFPPYLKDVPGYKMTYPPQFDPPEDSKFALGHPFFSLFPGLFAFATIWVREHNRICDILRAEHPNWDDTRLYETVRLINVGQSIQITIREYVQQLSQYKLQLTFEPHLIHETRFQFDNRIRAEFVQAYHFHPIVPDTIKVDESTSYSIEDMLFNNNIILEHGIDKFVEALVTNRAGELTSRNHPSATIPVLKQTLQHSRSMRFQSINNYRRKFGVKPFSSFFDMTGDEDLANNLEELYHDIDAVEFYVGLLAEKPGASFAPLSMVNILGPYSIKGMMSNPMCSPNWWKPSTFGGNAGFQIVQTASLKKLFCDNMVGKCKGFDLSFKVPDV